MEHAGWIYGFAFFLTTSGPPALGVPGFWTLNRTVIDTPSRDVFPKAECQADVLELRTWPPSSREKILVFPRQLTVAPGLDNVTFVDGCGNSRVFGTGRLERLQYGTSVAGTRTQWDDRRLIQEIAVTGGGRISVLYVVEGDQLLVTQIAQMPSETITVTYRYDSDMSR